MTGEISYDLIMEPDMSFVEGTFRVPGQDWQVVIVSRRDVSTPQARRQKWDSGVTGIRIAFPRGRVLNHTVVEELLTSALGVESWVRVRGPDSMNLR